jgi:putative addiction module killer protein
LSSRPNLASGSRRTGPGYPSLGPVLFLGRLGEVDRKPSVSYKIQMLTVRETEEFSRWLKALRDIKAKAKILVRVQRLAAGNPGDVKPVGDGISELRIHHGAGYRVYYVQRGGELIVLLCGGDKDSQDKDIAKAKEIARELEE